MTNKDNIKELFSQGLQDHQVLVDPALWSSISSSIGTSVAKTSLGLLSKTIIGVAASSIIGVAVYFSVQNTNTTSKKINNEQKTISPQPDKIQNRPINTEKSIEPSIEKHTPIGLNISILNDSAFENQLVQQQGTSIQEQIDPSNIIQHHSLSNAAATVQVQGPTHIEENNPSTLQNPTPTASIQRQNQVTQTKNPERIVLPNIFTPNGDDQNETLQINWQQADVKDFSIVVLDAKNNVVYKDSNPQFEWDGTDLGGEKLSRGTYIYFVTAVLNGQKWQQSSGLQIQY